MRLFKSVEKIRADHETIRTEEKQSLLFKTIGNLDLNLPQNGLILNSSQKKPGFNLEPGFTERNLIIL
jgi:hypothetical protein